MRFAEKLVLVTGAASGIGRSTALAFAAEGAKVLAADINEAGLEETASLCGDSGEIKIQSYDASSRESCFGLLRHTEDSLGGLDVLCNIAGFAMSKHFTDYSEQDWEGMLSVNLSGVFYCTQAAIPLLLDGGGSIVNMASSAGLEGQAYHASYCATKAGVVMLTKSLALEYARRGIRANAVCPGGVMTPLTERFSMPDDIEPDLFQRLMPLVDPAMPEEIAAAILYLASEEARYINGVAFPIDGAQTAG